MKLSKEEKQIYVKKAQESLQQYKTQIKEASSKVTESEQYRYLPYDTYNIHLKRHQSHLFR